MSRRVLMLNALTEQSGGGVRFWSIAKEIALRGYSLSFLERAVAKSSREKITGISYRSIRETGVLWLDILRALWFNIFHGLAFRPNYVFALKPLPNSCLPALFLRILFKCKIVLDVDDLDFAYYPDKLRQTLVRACFDLFPRYFDLITTPNKRLRQFLIDEIGISPKKIHCLDQGVEVQRFVQAQPDNRYQKKWNLASNADLLVYCASLGMTSDFEYVLPILVECLRKHDYIKILVVGDGIRKQSFVEKVEAQGLQNRILFAGYIPHPDMPGILKLAQVGINYMAPTLANQYRVSIKVREYLAAGLNVVCNPVGDAESLKDFVTLCPRLEDFPDAIRKAFEVKSRKRTAAARRFLESNYSWPLLVEDFLSNAMNSH